MAKQIRNNEVSSRADARYYVGPDGLLNSWKNKSVTIAGKCLSEGCGEIHKGALVISVALLAGRPMLGLGVDIAGQFHLLASPDAGEIAQTFVSLLETAVLEVPSAPAQK